MKYKILQLDEHGRISFSKEELEKLLDEVYEEGRRDGYGWRYYPYIYTTCSSGSTITTDPNGYTTTKDTSPYTKTIRVGDDLNSTGYTTVTINKTE